MNEDQIAEKRRQEARLKRNGYLPSTPARVTMIEAPESTEKPVVLVSRPEIRETPAQRFQRLKKRERRCRCGKFVELFDGNERPWCSVCFVRYRD